MKPYKYLAGLAMATLTLSGCTNLDETVYDQISSNNYFNTKELLWRSVLLSTAIGQ